jgi:uncharacterized protein YcnI
MKTTVLTAAALLVAAAALAHVTVAPQQSQQGTSQVYKVRVHNEEAVATTSIELDVPEAISVTDVAPLTTGKAAMGRRGGRVATITWNTDIAPGKYVELAFTATNPAAPTSVQWIVHQRLADGKIIDWSDKPGAHGKASVTKIVAPAAPAK